MANGSQPRRQLHLTVVSASPFEQLESNPGLPISLIAFYPLTLKDKKAGREDPLKLTLKNAAPCHCNFHDTPARLIEQTLWADGNSSISLSILFPNVRITDKAIDVADAFAISAVRLMRMLGLGLSWMPPLNDAHHVYQVA